MKMFPGLLGVLVLLLAVAFWYQHKQTVQLAATVAAMKGERDDATKRQKTLEESIAALRQREATLPAAEAPRTAVTASSTTVPKIVPVATPGVSVTPPAGWARNGSKPGAYAVGVDMNQTWGGMPSAYVKSLESSPDGFGGMMQTVAAEDFTGKRVRLSGWIKTENANDGGGHLWLRVDGEQGGQPLQFDNMNNRAVKGTTDWQEASVVLDVPAGASALAYGFFVQGGGQMWVSGTRMEEVGPDVPSTNMGSSRKPLPKAPTNLGFDPKPSK